MANYIIFTSTILNSLYFLSGTSTACFFKAAQGLNISQLNFESLSVLQDETGDADAFGRRYVPLDDPPAHGVVLGELDEVDEVDGVDLAADEGVEAARAGGERNLDLLAVTTLKLPPSPTAGLVEFSLVLHRLGIMG